jgi:ORF6N domain
MTAQITVQDTSIPLVEHHGQRVVTFTMVDKVHQRPGGTARKRFNDNKKHFVKKVDFHVIDSKGMSEFRTNKIFGKKAQRGTLLTETGYLMLVKSFTDDLAWQVQRDLVNNYFNKPTQPALDHRLLTPAHQREIQKLVAAKVHASNAGRGGYSTIYVSIKDQFHVGTYKDVPDDRYEDLMLYIESIELEDGELLRALPLSNDQIKMIIEVVTEKISAEYSHTSKQDSEPKPLVPPPKPPAKHYPPRTLYDLDYIEDLRGDDSQTRNAGWWRFERPGGETNWAGEGTGEQGEHFFQQTRELAKANPKDAVEAITWCLMHFTGSSVDGIGFHGCEAIFCQQIARAAVAWMAAAHELQPPSYEIGRRCAN